MQKEIISDSLRVEIFEDRHESGEKAASDGAEAIRRLLTSRDKINIIFAAAPSQDDTLRALASASDVDWSRVRAFHMDEYAGMPRGSEQSFGYYLKTHIFGKVPFGEVCYINGAAEDSAAECQRYTELLRRYPPDIVFLGIGENGHIAFNDPGVADFDDPEAIKLAALDDVCRMQQVHDGCFPDISAVPTHAYTLTVPTLFSAAYLFCTVPGSSKADAVRRTVYEPISEKCPATIMRRHAHAVMYCDRESGALLL